MAGVAAWDAVLFDVKAVTLDVVVVVVHIVDVLVENVGLKNPPAAWNKLSVVSRAANATATTSTTAATIAAAATTVAAIASTIATTSATAEMTTTAAPVFSIDFGLAVNLSHHVVSVFLFVFIFELITILQDLEVLVNGRASFGPEVDNQSLNKETHIVLLFIGQS